MPFCSLLQLDRFHAKRVCLSSLGCGTSRCSVITDFCFSVHGANSSPWLRGMAGEPEVKLGAGQGKKGTGNP